MLSRGPLSEDGVIYSLTKEALIDHLLYEKVPWKLSLTVTHPVNAFLATFDSLSIYSSQVTCGINFIHSILSLSFSLSLSLCLPVCLFTVKWPSKGKQLVVLHQQLNTAIIWPSE